MIKDLEEKLPVAAVTRKAFRGPVVTTHHDMREELMPHGSK